MPAVAASGQQGGGDELGPGDEIKVFKDEGEDEREQGGSETLQAELLEEKSSLITDTESEQFGKHGDLRRPEAGPPFSVPGFPGPFGMGYLVNPYAAYANGAMGRGGSPLSPFLPDPLGSPPPAHMGSLPYDKATMAAALRPPLYPGYPYPSLGSMEQLAAWHRNPYSIPLSSASPGSPMARFSPSGGLLPPHHLPFGSMPHHLPHIKQEYGDRPPHLIHPHDDKDGGSPKKKEPHIKKPLNAFMLYMKEMRPVVQAECTLKESAAINQILGRRWHGLTREEQAKYYEKARQERQRHMQMYPHWNARDNYRYGQKKKKRKRDKTDDPAANMKKCRARYGLDQQNLWCKPCRRKKKCIRVQMYLAGRSEQEIEATTFDEDGEAITPTGLNLPGQMPGGGSSNGSDGEGDNSPAGSVESSDHSVTSPATPGVAGSLHGSLPSLGSPASIASPSTPGEDWYSRRPHHRPPVGTDPRDSNNPLSISSLTSRDMVPSPSSYSNGHTEKLLQGVI